MEKSRLDPIKSVSIPKLKLTAAVLAVKLDELAKRKLNMPQNFFIWLDSTAVLSCIRNITKRFLVFVANSLATIESLTIMAEIETITNSRPLVRSLLLTLHKTPLLRIIFYYFKAISICLLVFFLRKIAVLGIGGLKFSF